jgi:predicted alpha/beta hydrolase family esterase
VASSDDPYVSVERAREFADAWRSTFTELGSRGHINPASGFGEWPRGEALLQELM